MSESQNVRLTGWKLKLSKYFIVPQRVILSILASIAVVNSYTLRNCLSVAITEMVNEKGNETEEKTLDICDYPELGNHTKLKLDMIMFDWSKAEIENILSSFYWGYFISHVPGGFLAEYFGGKHVLGLGILWTGLLTLITPIITIKFDLWGMLILRFLMGLGEGVTFPGLNALMSDWVPESERSRLGTLAFSGILIGNVLANVITGWLIKATLRWDTCFYLFGFITVVWYVFWQPLCYSSPETHPFISDAEYYFLQGQIAKKQYTNIKAMPWCGIFSNIPLWSLIIAQVGSDWGLYTIITNLPLYMKHILKYEIDRNGLLSSLPSIAMWVVSILSALVADWLLKSNKMRIVTIRKLFGAIAGVGPGLFLVLASYSGCNRMMAISCFCLAMGTMGCYYPSLRVNALDLSRSYSGTLMALVNGLAVLSGIFAPLIIAQMVSHGTMAEWRLVFWACAIILIGSAVIYVIWASGESQKFNEPDYVWPGCCKK